RLRTGRDRRYFCPRLWFPSRREDVWDKESDPKEEFASGYPLRVSRLKTWPEKDKAVRLRTGRDRRYFCPRLWFPSRREDIWDKESDPKEEFASGYPLRVTRLKTWPEKDKAVRFVEIASLNLEVIEVTCKGELH
ncbi:hypothetical protein pipiens_000660, partial [Culex pipiens pipiens]